MGWMLWGMVFAWGLSIAYHYSQREKDADTTLNGAMIVLCMLILAAGIISIGLGIQSGAIPSQPPTPTSLGR